MPTETAGTMDVSQAYEAAKAEQPQGQALDSSEAAGPIEGETETGEPTVDKATAQAQPEAGADQLLTDEEYAKHKDNPEELRRALNKSYTEKTMKLADQRKLAEAFESDPKGFIKRYAQAQGLQIVDPSETAKAETEKVKTQEQAASALDGLRAELGLGEELNFLLPAFEKVAEWSKRTARAELQSELKPIQERAAKEAEKAVQEQANQIMEQFFTKVPDARPHQQAMDAMSAKFHIGPGVDPMEYLGALHSLVTRDVSEAERTKKVIKRVNDSVKAADNSAAGVNAGRVKPQRPPNMTVEQAFEYAKQGIDFGEE